MKFKQTLAIMVISWLLVIYSGFVANKAVRDKKIAEEKTAKLQLQLHIEESTSKDTVGQVELAKLKLEEKDKEIHSLEKQVNNLQEQLKEIKN